MRNSGDGTGLGFRQRVLLAASGLVICALTSFALYNDYLKSASLRAGVEQQLVQVGDQSTRLIETWLAGRVALLEATAQSIALQGNSDFVAALLAQPVVARQFDYIYRGRGRDGEFISLPEAELPAGYDPRQRPWFKEAIEKGRTILTEPYVDEGPAGMIMTIATPVAGNGRAEDVVGSDLGLKTLVDLINGTTLGGLGYAFLISGDGKILVHPDKSLTLTALASAYPELGAKPAQMTEISRGGRPELVTLTHLDGLPQVDWYLAVSIDKDKAFADVGRLRTYALIATLIATLLTLVCLDLLMRWLMRPLRDMSAAMQDIARGEGDLTQRLKVLSKDEFGTLAQGFNVFIGKMQQSMGAVAASSTQLNDITRQVLTASHSALASSAEQSSRTQCVAAAIHQLEAAAQEIAVNAANASTQAAGARQLTVTGGRVLEDTIVAIRELSLRIETTSGNMQEVSQQSSKIERILEVIAGISQRTNLLALNAAIEAARAGDAGRGFAVVADEVRNLAQRTQASTFEIRSMIDGLQGGTLTALSTMQESRQQSEQSVVIAQSAGEQLGQVTARILDIDGINQSVAAATEQQTSVVSSITRDVTQIEALNQSGVETLKQTLQCCQSLQVQGERLQALVSGFRV